ncbi:uncharacterized protein LOC123879395 [Maniola jurtina]|uniref:uncharacterized protein LOC123879395 n=1 Tax=Maniola jurtina TaxID=191418 RepID=UPI001E68F405|nr:uncharacterized protein LOC123879395 [Maniola jurtina]XP_045783018.1 uncharacterized protein LOC123879395 [Maniola jurtina]XP_045783020.1 uncharacterized protein LOC123879395 [Maniola jurtina]
MAGTKCVKGAKYLAKLADTNAPCAFCRRDAKEETAYGKLYSIGNIHCHYFCVLLSCCLIQKGKDEEGLFGFMYPDILAEIERSKKHRCSYCGVEGATLGCSITQCKKQFHLPCGREKKAVSLYYGNYKSYCEKHAPKQKLPAELMSKVRSRLAKIRQGNQGKSMRNLKAYSGKETKKTECTEDLETVCVICYEAVDGFPSTETFWPPCCARDAWFHRSCLQRMAFSAGLYYFKCPLCNDKDRFYSAVVEQGYFIPDRDAAWELDQNAFSGIYERPVECRADVCICTLGRKYDADSGRWDIKLCVLCGGPGSHQACLSSKLYVCAVCSPAAPDLSHLEVIDAVSLPTHEQETQHVPSGPIMPSRMSIRRTKPRPTLNMSSTSSQNVQIKTEIETNAVKSNTDLSREDLNLKTPRRPTTNMATEQKQPGSLTPRIPLKQDILTTEQNQPENNLESPLKLLKQPENELLSPLKLLKQGLNEKISNTEVEKVILDREIVEEMREKFKTPKPACVKRRIVSEILERLLDCVMNEQNVEWKKSPEKLKESIEDAKNDEDKENALDLTMKHSSYIQNEDMSLRNDISKTPEHISKSSEQHSNSIQNKDLSFGNDISKTPEHTSESSEQHCNIQNENLSLQIDISKTSEQILESSEQNSCNIQNEDVSLQNDISKTPEHILESSERNHLKSQEQNCLKSYEQLLEHKVSEPLEENILHPSTLEQLIICENANLTPKKATILEDDSSDSTSPFQLPPEFIAESSNSLPIIETPRKLKKINLENDSMEISENNQIVNIDLVKVENIDKDFKISEKKCAFKLSPLNKNISEKNLDIDLESFKNQYLNEVDRKFNCNFEHNHENLETVPTKLKTIDFAIDVLKKPPKRKLPASDDVASKKRKTTKIVRESKKQHRDRALDRECNRNRSGEKSDCKNDSDEKTRYKKRRAHADEKNKDKSDNKECNVEKKRRKKLKHKKNHNTELSIRNRNINLKIRFKSEELNLKISKPKKRGRKIKKDTPKVLKQYVLQYPLDKISPKDCIARPDTDVTPIKKKYNIKCEKSSDSLKQTSISNFFKISPKT